MHDITAADAMTPDQLHEHDETAELHQDALDDARYASEGDPWIGGEMQEAELGAHRARTASGA